MGASEFSGAQGLSASGAQPPCRAFRTVRTGRCLTLSGLQRLWKRGDRANGPIARQTLKEVLTLFCRSAL
jgi:hypothetical protein